MKRILKNPANLLTMFVMALAMALTLSCSTDDVKEFLEGGSSSSGGGSSSSIATAGGAGSSSSGGGAQPSSSSRVSNGLPDYEVTTAEEFVAAIGPDRNILLAEGTYNISDYDLQSIDNEYVSWNVVEDGYQMNVYGVDNMTILGMGEVNLIVDPRYSFVIKFFNSYHITIENVTAGHSEGGGECEGGVFGFNSSEDIEINNVNMYGSGTVGLELNEVENMKVANSTIFECTYHIMKIYNSKDITFENNLFFENMKFEMVYISNTSNVVFDNCDFEDNQSLYDNYFFEGHESSDILIKNSTFTDNEAGAISNSSSIFNFQNCSFDGNSWQE